MKEGIVSDSVTIQGTKQLLALQYNCTIQKQGNHFQKYYTRWKGENHVIVYIKKDHCKACVIKILLDFLLLKERTGFDKFVLMGSLDEKNDLYSYVNQIDYEFSFEFIPKEYQLFKEVDFPVVFVVDPYLNIQLLYVPDLLPELREQYFYTILLKYLK